VKLVVGGVLSILIGVFFLYLYYATCRGDARRRAWPVADGTIISSTIKSVVTGSEGSSTSGRTLEGAMTNKVTYEYAVDGRQYEGDRLTYHPWTIPVPPEQIEPPDTLLAVQREYRESKQVKVFYDPADHSRSYLMFRETGGKMVQVAIGAIMTLIGGMLLFFGLRPG
jgi:hypothetical protein